MTARARAERRRPLAGALAVVGALLVLAGCGSDDDDAAVAPSTVAAVSTTPAAVGTSDAAVATTTPASVETSGPAVDTTTATDGGGATRTVTDAANRKVAIPVEAARLGLPHPRDAIDVLLLGGCDKIAAATEYNKTNSFFLKFCPAIADVPTPYQDDPAWNIEDIISAGVDLQLGQPSNLSSLEQLAKADIPGAVLSDSVTLTELRDNVVFEATLMGGSAPDRAAAFAAYFDRQYAKVKAVTDALTAAQRPKVLAVLSASSGPILAAAGGSIMDEWITVGGGVNVAHDIAGIAPAEVSPEQILQWNPDVIVVGLPADKAAIMADPRLSAVTAVSSGRVLVNPAGTIIWMYYGSEEALNFQWVATMLHPDLFPDLDIAAETKAFYTQFFDYELTDAEVHTILEPPG